jgi:RNA polymerase sigma factor (sigma-70 family)
MMDLTTELANKQTRQRIAATVNRKLGPDDVDDVMQDVYLSLLERAPDAPPLKNPTAYCRTLARHKATDLLAERWHESMNLSRLSFEPGYPGNDRTHELSPETIIDTAQHLDYGLRTLPRTTLDALLLVVAQGRTYEEAAERLGVSSRTVRARIQGARLEAPSAFRLHGMQPQKRKSQPPASKFNGTLYELDTTLELPAQQIIADVEPKLCIASAALADRLKACPEGVHDLTSRQFETLVAELLADMTTGPVEITPFTRDGGRDLLAYVDLRFGRLLCLIEAKKYHPDRRVGIELVRSLYGVVCHEDASHGTVVTTATFSRDARHFEAKHQHRLSLRDYQNVADWIRRYRASPSPGLAARR